MHINVSHRNIVKTITKAAVQEARLCLLASARIKKSPDPSDALLVLISGSLSAFHGELFVPQKFSDQILKDFGWRISTHAIEFFIPKMRKLGWIESRDRLPASGPYTVNLPQPETAETGAINTREQLSDLGSRFRDFSRDISPLNNLPSDDLEAGAVLLSHLVDQEVDFYSEYETAANDDEYLALRFVETAALEDEDLTSRLAALKALGFVFRVAEEITNPSTKRRSSLRLVLDGPLILDYLGVNGPVRTGTISEIISDMRSIGVSIVTFQHCIDEATEIMRQVLQTNPRDRYGPMGDALRKGLVHENALTGILQGFDASVKSKDIEVLPDNIEYLPSSHQYFSQEKLEDLESIINWHDEEKKHARERDTDTTVLTIRRRAGHRTSDIFESRFVCVTNNATFAGATKRHLTEIAYYNSRQVPPIIPVKELAAKVWLEIGNNSIDDRLKIPRAEMLMSCERSLGFNRKVVDKAKEELSAIKPDQLEQFEFLLQVPRSARAVADFTMNNENYVSGENVELLVEAAVDAAGVEAVTRWKQKNKEQKEEFDSEIATISDQLSDAKTAAQLAIDSVREAQQRDNEMLESLRQKYEIRFIFLRNLFRSIAAVATLISLFIALKDFISENKNPIVVIIAVLASAVAISTVMDKPGAWVTKLIQEWCRRRAESVLHDIARSDLANTIEWRWVNDKLEWYSNTTE